MSGIPTRPTLLLRIRNPDDEAAWESLAALYTPLVFQYGIRRGLQEADAKDVTQDAMRAVAKAIRRFEYDQDKGLFRQWLCIVIRSKLNHFFGRDARKPHPIGDTPIHELTDSAEDDPDGVWEQEYRRHLIRSALELIRPEIEERTFKAFWRTTIEDADVASTARELDITPAAIYAAKYRIVQKLRVAVAEISGETDLIPT
ncbi:MAG: RNA polymerase sigma factor (sigma-70 family) [Kiritimatiellia bacterium]|jgi:RNA polymerase sigma factor (sigma-70 family)